MIVKRSRNSILLWTLALLMGAVFVAEAQRIRTAKRTDLQDDLCYLHHQLHNADTEGFEKPDLRQQIMLVEQRMCTTTTAQ